MPPNSCPLFTFEKSIYIPPKDRIQTKTTLHNKGIPFINSVVNLFPNFYILKNTSILYLQPITQEDLYAMMRKTFDNDYLTIVYVYLRIPIHVISPVNTRNTDCNTADNTALADTDYSMVDTDYLAIMHPPPILLKIPQETELQSLHQRTGHQNRRHQMAVYYRIEVLVLVYFHMVVAVYDVYDVLEL